MEAINPQDVVPEISMASIPSSTNPKSTESKDPILVTLTDQSAAFPNILKKTNPLKVCVESSHRNNIELDTKIKNKKHELQQLLTDTRLIIDNISKHDDDAHLVHSLRDNVENIESTLSVQTNAQKTTNKNFPSPSFRTVTTRDVTNIGQTRIEQIDSVQSKFENQKEIDHAKPWMPNHQHCIQKYYESTGSSQEQLKGCTKPMIRYSLTKPVNRALSPSLTKTNLHENTNKSSQVNIDDIEQEINEIHSRLQSPRKPKDKQIEIVGIDIPLNQYYLKHADYVKAQQDLRDKMNLKLTKNDIQRIFKEDEQKMDINEFNVRLNKINKVRLNNVELKCLNEELKTMNDDIRNDSMFSKDILTTFLT
eukprot:726099_1